MAEKEEVQEVENSEPELTPEQEAEAFSRGFETAHKPDEYEAEAQAPAEDQTEEVQEAPREEEEPVLEEFGMTASQLKQKLAAIDQIQHKYEQDISRVFGKFGEINRHLQAQRQQGPGRLNKLSLKKLKEEYPDVAELLESDLSESIGRPGPSFDPSEVDRRLQGYAQSLEQKIRNDFEARLLAMKHPDFTSFYDGQNQRWKDLDAKEWVETVADEETKRNLLRSRDAAWVASKLDELKAWKKEKYAGKQSSKKRLERAVAPSTTNARAPGPSDYDEFVAGFKSARQLL